jgi:ABC-type glutathione transport system ATPase component
MNIRLASFGDVGGELLRAAQEDRTDRAEVSRKISEKGFLSEADARKLLNQLQIVSVVESELKERIFNILKNLCTGIDPVPAFEMLNFWLYCCAENKCKITQNDVIQRINDVGRFVAERNAHHGEWFRSIIPIENNDIDAQTQEKLSNEFYRGISARYDHILADVDKPRISKLYEISQKFKNKQIVIVHGASGQGKTTIAYRYLHDYFPDQWRFQVRLIENRQQALNIATALSGQAKAIGIPIAVYLDISPNDIGWDELVKQLSLHRNIQILVSNPQRWRSFRVKET